VTDPVELFHPNSGLTPSEEAPSNGPSQNVATSSKQSVETSPIDLALVWRELLAGVELVVGELFSNTRCGLVLAPKRSGLDRSRAGRRLEIIEAVLAGVGQNCIAIDLELAPSTVALNAKQALEDLGVGSRPSHVHPLLMLMATAARRGLLVAGLVSYVQSAHGEVLRVLEVPRPGQRLHELLPSAERQVIELLIEGRCYAEIAAKRGTAVRTVANQIAAVFRRLNVSGRSELIQRLFVVDGVLPPPASVGSTLPPPTVREPLSRQPRDDVRASGIRPLSSLNPQLQAFVAGVRER
jgi:DNA-binding NarL/FixJ family response regulator